MTVIRLKLAVRWGAVSAGPRLIRSSTPGAHASSVGRQAAPLAATQDTSGEERQDPCPVLQPLAQPASHLQLWPATADPLWR